MKQSIATFYPKTRYGAKNINEGPFCTLQLEALDVKPLYAMEHKSVIFVVDLSGSMKFTLPHVKRSMLAFRSVLFPTTSVPNAQAIAHEWRHNLHIVAFSDTASHVWSSDCGKTFEEAILSMEVDSSTNMGAGIEMAFQLVNPAKATWIVVLTDGVSNMGKYQTAEQFSALAKMAPSNVKLVTIGYGLDFDPVVLSSLGEYSHIRGVEDIPKLMGALAHEVSTASAFGVRIVELGESKAEIKIGQTSVGVLSTGRKFIFGFVPSSVTPSTGPEPLMSCYDLRVQGRYITARGLTNFASVLTLACDWSSEAPESVRKAFYASEAARLIVSMYNTRNIEKTILEIKYLISFWTEECAIEAKEAVLRIANERGEQPNFEEAGAIYFASSATRQNSYTIDAFVTPGGKTASKQSSDSVKFVYQIQWHRE